MLSCAQEPFAAFCKDLHIEGADVHLYKGPNAFGSYLLGGADLPWWDTENVYFLAGVKSGLQKRAADADVRYRGVFTLDFDIRKECEKRGLVADLEEWAGKILLTLEDHPLWGKFRYVVMSGNGMHVHYFGEPVAVQKELWSAGMKKVFEEVNALTPMPCDTGCGNAGRIMRMPGSWNVKGGGKLPVDFLLWMPQSTLPPLSFVQDLGAKAIAEAEKIKEQVRANFEASHPDGGSDVIDLINSIPIEQVVAQTLGCRVGQTKKDGGLRFIDDKGVERGFFKHREYNIIVHEGTSLFPAPSGVGYNCLSLARTVLSKSTRDTILWFAERSRAIRDAMEREKEEWKKEQGHHEFSITDWRDLLPKNQ